MASLNILIYQSKRIIDCLDSLIYLGRFMLSTIILYMHVRSVYNFANIMKISVSRLEEISKCF